MSAWARRHPWSAHAVAAVLLFTIAFALVRVGPLARDQISDVPLYQRAGEAMLDGRVPYRDFEIEYPPGALLVFLLPAAPNPFDYARAFQVEMYVCGVAIVIAVAAALAAIVGDVRHARLPLAFVGLSPLLVGPILLSRYDLWPAALTVIALAALTRGHDRAGAVGLGIAVAAKLYAAALLPLLAIDVWRRRGRAAAIRFCALVVGVTVVVFLPFAMLAPSGVWRPITNQIHRPLQLEALGAAVLIAWHQLTGMRIHSFGSYGSGNLAAPGADVAATLSTVISVLVVAIVCVAYARGATTRGRFCVAAAAIVSALVAFGKVLSPQYLLWLVPLAPLAVTARRYRLGLALLAVAMALTQTWYPQHYGDTVDRFEEPWTWFLLVRDLLLVAVALLFTLDVTRGARPRALRWRPSPKRTAA